MSKQSFFQEFKPISKEQWLERIHKDLKGADFDEKLVWHTEEGFDVMPFYTAEDLSGLEHLQQIHQTGFNSEDAFLGARHWKYCQEIVVENAKSANLTALDALNEGAEAICFNLCQCQNLPAWEVLFDQIQWEYCDIAFLANDHQQDWALSLTQYWASLALPASAIKGFWKASSLKGCREAVRFFEAFPNFKGIALQHKGANPLKVSEKIGTLLHQFYQCVNAEQSASSVLANSCFHYELDNNYFFQIAGLRALKLLTTSMLQAYGETAEAAEVNVHAITTITVNENTKQDPEWNMLSNTSQAMSGVLGACQYLSIRPHNQGIAPVDRFAERIARNVSNILRDESYFDKVADPVAGAYYLEYLTEQLAAKAWQYFQAQL